MHFIFETYGMLASIEMEIATSHSKKPAVEAALREAEQHVVNAQASLRAALMHKGNMEE